MTTLQRLKIRLVLTLCSDDIVNLSEEDDPPELRYASSKNPIFADDPWNAMCVLGLRVYSQNAVAKVSVIKGKNSS